MAINLSDPFPGMAFVFHPNDDDGDGDGDNDFNTFTVSLVVNIVSGGKLVMIVMTNIIVFVFTERRAHELNFKLEVFLPDSLSSPSNKLANEKDLPKLSTPSFATKSSTPLV